MPNTDLLKWTSLFFVAASVGFFIGALLLTHRKGNRYANRVLGVVVLVFSISLASNTFYWAGYRGRNWTNFGLLANTTMLLYGPLFLFYLNSIYERPTPRKWLHLLPWALNMLFIIPILFKIKPVLKAWYAPNRALINNLFAHVLVTMYCISLVAYSIYLLRQYKRKPVVSVSLNPKQQTWAVKVTWCFALFAASILLYYILVRFNLLREEFDYLISAVTVYFIYSTGILGFRQPELFGYAHANGRKPVNGKYEKSSLKKVQTETIAQQLQQLMNERKVYLDSELTLQSLAGMMHCSTHHLSQVINEQFGVSYPELVNRHRVDEARRILSDPRFQEEKILGVAFEVGYNNKTTFNMVFKRLTGSTPSEYRKKVFAMKNSD